MILSTVLPGLFLLGLVIFVHELGHFLVAKWRGVRVLRFALGFGPALIAFRRGETEYRISWIPLGGYVQMAGDSPGDDGTMGGGHDEFLSHPWFGRLLIAVAGPLANLVTAFLVLFGMFWLVGVSIPDGPNVLGATPDTSLAYRAGLREGDRIVSLAGKPTDSWVRIFLTHSNTPQDQPAELVYERDGERRALVIPANEREPLFSSFQLPPRPPVVGGVVTGMPAYKAGLKVGDRVLSVNGQPIHDWYQLPAAFDGRVDQPTTVRVRRGDRELDLTITPIDAGATSGQRAGRIGIEAPRDQLFVQRQGLLESLDLGLRSTGALVANVYGGMYLTVTRLFYYKEYLGGPLFIAQAASENARRGLDSYLQYLAMINIAIMAFNLLPLPLLDGGHILLALLQAVRRQAISARAYIRFQKVGLVVIGTLFVFILANDPLRILQRQRAIENANQETPVETTPP